MKFRYYHSKAKVPISIKWECSKCSHNNEVFECIASQAGTPAVLDEKFSKDVVSNDVKAAYENLVNEVESENYRVLRHKTGCLCDNCDYQEPWAKMYHYSVIDYITIIVAIISGLIALVTNSAFFWVVFGLAVAYFIGKTIFMLIKNGQHNKLAKKLPKRSLPKVSLLSPMQMYNLPHYYYINNP